MTQLIDNRYGKHKVRVLKVLQEDEGHRLCELEADVLLQGDLDGSYHSEDNSSIVPTDTVKNTVHVLAHDHLDGRRTAFAQTLAEHFLQKYDHLTGASVELRERSWSRMETAGTPHPHSFVADLNGTSFSQAQAASDQATILSGGIRDHLILKTTESGFENYNVCDLTSLPPTSDRILSTRLTAQWSVSKAPKCDGELGALVLASAHAVFAETYSPSVQRTLFQIGEAVLEASPEISEIELQMPNVHFLNLDLSKFGHPDQKKVFLPTDEPHGEIRAVVGR